MEIKNLCKHFGDKVIFNNFNATINDGITFILGESGCGKSTLLKMIMGVYSIDSGKIIYPKGTKFSVVFQENRLFENLTLEENIKFVTDNPLNMELVKELHLTEYLGKKVRELSGGTQRRVALLRALSAPFDVLILDEPFTGLDKDVKIDCMNKILSLNKSILISTHDESVIDYMRSKTHIDILEVK